MAFNLKRLLGKKNKTPEAELEEFEELGDKEKPEGITGEVKAKLPQGTNIEPKVLIGIGLVLCFILSFVIAHGLQDPDEKTAQQKAEEDFKKKTTTNSDGLPDEFGQMPGSYASLKDRNLNKDKNSKQNEPNSNITRPVQPPISSRNYDPMPYAVTPRASVLPQAAYMMQATQSPQEKERADALRSSIRFGGTAEAASPLAALAGLTTPSYAPQPMSAPAQSSQEKQSFIDRNSTSSAFYVRSSLQSPISQFEIKAGTIIPGILIIGINSDLPGQIVAQVRENVYDSVTGDHLLIPLGAKLIGTYDSSVEYGQSRVLIVWNRLILPNGESQDLEGMIGADMAGYSGFSGRKNDHIPRILNGVILGSLLTAGARVATGGVSDVLSYSQLAGQGVAENIAQSAAKITDRNLDVQPTIEISPGYVFNVFVNKDLILKPYQG